MAKLKIELKQHTPLIHFQSEQPGAILRATEVKPKLDRFLQKYAFADGFDEYKQYLIGYKAGKKDKMRDLGDKQAFDYKLRIYTENPNKIQKINIKGAMQALYFAGRSNNGNVKGILTNEDIILEFFTFHKGLMEIIKNNIEGFFCINNFGTRQNKGFGSFYLKKPINEVDKLIDRICTHDKTNIYLNIKYNKGDYFQIFEDISVIYPLMKSGLNFPKWPKSYHKSFLFKYMLNKDIGNEKRFIKENFFSPWKRIENDNKEKRYVRALLGICDGIEFRDPERKGKVKYNSDIERFQSPILFKIINNELFIIPKKIPKEMFYNKFKFSNEFKSGKESKVDKEIIYTPKEDEFNLENFLSGFADYFNNHIKVSNANNVFENKIRKAKLRRIDIKQVVK
ncbi:TPA: hypothetical protein PTV74_001229 [Clostridium botulinum]|uniref:hypothetical protein n=1 Tax=Clostridium botulinum TaxID=1491 RepID=UPI000D0D3198|nr:hypothetical protein [Clostridium botulinum]PSM01429.1 hypothetical protein C6C12_10790 [Clostridium botulinum]HDK7163647.1 hypothetical protein [Clostridium botulinum]HDK7171122.1 hypothetical protein [Clostridium botulinum]HDK7182175.1 hypothetical protein [Clostridium botulinum]HDK7185895.1 hypothetical protein [Clostridium botulinum]